MGWFADDVSNSVFDIHFHAKGDAVLVARTFGVRTGTGQARLVSRICDLRRHVRSHRCGFNLHGPDTCVMNGALEQARVLSDIGDSVSATLHEVQTLIAVGTSGTSTCFALVDELATDLRQPGAHKGDSGHLDCR